LLRLWCAISPDFAGIHIFDDEDKANFVMDMIKTAEIESGFDEYRLNDDMLQEFAPQIYIRKNNDEFLYILHYRIKYRNLFTEITYFFPVGWGKDYGVKIINPIMFLQMQKIMSLSLN
jgi:hypothetical protein